MSMKHLGIGISAVIGLATFGACAMNAAVSGDTDDDQVGVASQSVSSACGPTTPLAPVCNVSRCTADGWVDWPVAAGSTCLIAGIQGMCDGGEVTAGDVVPDRIGQCVIPAGSLNPQYYVLGVIYAPPGFNGDSLLASSVTYANGNTMSHDTKVTNSFKQGVSVTASAEIPVLADTVIPVSGSVGGGYAVTDSTSGGLTVTNTILDSVQWSGPAVDGLRHDEDVIYLWLNPRVSFAQDGSSTLWTLGINPDTYAHATMDVQYVKVAWLKGTQPMPTGVANELAAHAIGPAQYAQLLALDPFATGGTTVDTTRFQDTGRSFPYETGAPQTTFSVTGTNATSTGTAHTEDTTVSATLTAGSSDTWTKLSVTGTWDWTSSTATTDTATTTQSASVTVTGPSAAYTGPSNIRVYYDLLYKTFMFQFITAPPVVVGTVTGTGAQHLEVDLVVGGFTYRTKTNSSGNYTFASVPGGAGTVHVGTQSRAIQIAGSRAPVRADFTLTKGL
jgi:hypothetical protein